jgi:uncharacterized protein (DUF2062 family)
MYTMTGFNTHTGPEKRSLFRRIAAPFTTRVQSVFLSGLTPQKLVLTLCIGSALGIMPLLWGTSLLCILFAHVFRLNHVALQSVNYLFYPLQLALLVPFFKLGAWLFPGGPPLPVNIFSSLIRNPGFSSINVLAYVTLKSLAAWLVTALPVTLILYGLLRVIAFKKRHHQQVHETI